MYTYCCTAETNTGCKANTPKKNEEEEPWSEKAKLVETAGEWLPVAGGGVPGDILMKEYKLPTVNK